MKLEKSNIQLEFPELLPVSSQRDHIMSALRNHQVVIVCGETGSGKTTQLPKICLAIGRGRLNGTGKLIGHTQPRRIAATATAKRIAEEIGTPLGTDVGYQVRFADKSNATASIKLMTDGILLAETQRDPLLQAYDTIIIDEAHERTLNIDFLLGYLKQLLPRRPDLKVVITSATIDANLFAEHFGTKEQPAPVIEVSGRLYPVELRYRPLEDSLSKESFEIPEGVLAAIHELWGVGTSGAGDILVFLPGEREINECSEVLRKDIVLQQRYHPEILSLFARQSVAEQERIFHGNAGRRIILSTNVAETSLTVPGIRFVIDSGLARVKRYSYRNKVEQLQIESISKAAANQRAGRCGRVADGICIRLFSEDEFTMLAPFTDPEILRSSLAAVILRMASLKLSNIQSFPFIQPPLRRAINDGISLLEELGAVEVQTGSSSPEVHLTKLGKDLAQLPLDPKVSRMLLAAKEYVSLREVLIISSAMSIQDPRERPAEYAQNADQSHRQFLDPQSEFLSFIKLWDWYEMALKQKQSNRQLDQLCKKNFISLRRMREWRDVYSQLDRLIEEKGWRKNTLPATFEQIHISLLTGLLGNIAKKEPDGNLYEGARGIKVNIWPGSSLNKKAGAWIVAAELVDTNRLYARTIAKIDPRWVERICQHRLVKKWSEPFWDPRSGEVLANEQGALYGLTLYHGRKVRYGPMEADEARKVFVQCALVEGALFGTDDSSTVQKKHGQVFHFFWHNQGLIREIEKLEHQSRRQDVLVSDVLLLQFYLEHLPQNVLSRNTLQSWLEKNPQHTETLMLKKEDLMRHQASGITNERYPKTIQMAGVALDVTYHFEPGSPKDGITLMVPLPMLNQIDMRRCEWLVPGLAQEKIVLLLKTLPQKLRRHCVPLPDFAKAFIESTVESERFGKGDLMDTLIDHIREKTRITVLRSDFRPENLPEHCLMNFRLLDEHGRQLDLERQISTLRTRYAKEAKEIFQEVASQAVKEVAGHEITSEEITTWSFGILPETLSIQRSGQSLFGYPALEDQQTHCSIEVFDDPSVARLHHYQGLRRLFTIAHKDLLKALHKQLPGAREVGLLYMSLGSTEQIMQQIMNLAVERACLYDPIPENEDSFQERVLASRGKLSLIAQEIAKQVQLILQINVEVSKKLAQAKTTNAPAFEDMSRQMKQLVDPNFIKSTPYEQLVHIPRYLKGIGVRVDKLRGGLVRDIQLQQELSKLQQKWQRHLQKATFSQQAMDPKLTTLRWQFEELRIALFAQELKTPFPMSIKRIEKILDTFQG